MEPHGLRAKLTEYGDREFAAFIRRSFAKSMGLSGEALGKPVVGIIDTSSDLNNCHRGLPELIAAVKRGAWQAGALPLEFPVISPGEVFCHPTSMLARNLMSMDVETMIRLQPLDSVVLAGGCDKTLPALLMGAASAGVPAITLAAGPMLAGRLRGEIVGACTDCRRFWAMRRAGEIDARAIEEIEDALAPTAGTCAVMGTASTMAIAAEALGMMLPGGATAPAVLAERLRHAEETGKAAARLAGSARTPAAVMTQGAFENAFRAVLAAGGSTNAVIHLTAIAGRLGIRIGLDDLNRLSEDTPLLADVKPAGRYFMEDLHAAGGVPALLREIRGLLRLDAMTVTGETVGQVLDRAPSFRGGAIRPADAPLSAGGALVALRGSLAPDGALIKRSAATAALFEKTGRAVVFESVEDLARRIDREDLDVRPDDFLVLAGAGPRGGPGMPEAGYLPIPRKLAAAGVKDMVRISDARMSGTAFGTVVLHVSPEAAAGGPLGLARSGDRIALSVEARRLDLLVAPDEIERRRAARPPPAPPPARGYERLYFDAVEQAHLGADFGFLRHESFQRSGS
jgi:dihydroxy-acid dehydratase